MNKIHQLVVGAIATNCWIYPLEKGACAVIDPGEDGSRIIGYLDHHNLFPEYILLTHGHFDHIGALPALSAKYGKRHIAIHAADAEYLGPDSYPVHNRSISIAAGSSAYLDALWEEMPPPDSTLEEGSTIGSFSVLHLPGHTPGSIGLWDKDSGVLFTGDTLFEGDYGRTDLPGGSEEQLFASLKRIFSMDGNIQVYPGHGGTTTIAMANSNLSGWYKTG
ncbi:MAG: MBL fold metallo-hydrolase [Treponema sp.]|nr:MBL fold metallo-hydrolase [Treponema sp.]